jgi:hypothetical protein
MDLIEYKLSRRSSYDNDDIYLDDMPVDSLLYRDTARCSPTPADIILLWAKGYPLTETKKKVLDTILINKFTNPKSPTP